MNNREQLLKAMLNSNALEKEAAAAGKLFGKALTRGFGGAGNVASKMNGLNRGIYQTGHNIGRGAKFVSQNKAPFIAGAGGLGAGAIGGASMYRNHARNKIRNMSIQDRLMLALGTLFNPNAVANRF